MNTEQKERCAICGGTGRIESGTRQEHGKAVPVFLACEGQANAPDSEDNISDFIGRIVIESPEKFWG